MKNKKNLHIRSADFKKIQFEDGFLYDKGRYIRFYAGPLFILPDEHDILNMEFFDLKSLISNESRIAINVNKSKNVQ